ncbi:hypothetical protein MSG28_013712 [Choristoneura fumiferana]|uniref:Uncharacterized protein n=2 Tax=Choristoneura fumiferana TaxID=7141 RepID=A0ACC0K8G0_CHOFU|nr:hypothetical protein MSG28_015887 [Choristoneura fumiferana]KAI8432753.1 hypothetical protein MSG28_013712 [Choristoneura fumiferana]
MPQPKNTASTQPKCAGCGKFTTNHLTDGAKCKKCSSVYHRVCVNLGLDARVSSAWVCPACKVQVPRSDNTDTPVKGSEQEGAGVDEPSPVQDLTREIRMFRLDVAAMREEMAGLRRDIAEMRSSIGGFQARFEAVEERISRLEARTEERAADGAGDHLANTVAELKAELNDRDQDLLLGDLEISGIPEAASENGLHLVGLVARKLGVALDERDIVFAERVGAPRRSLDVAEGGGAAGDASVGAERLRPRPLVVRLARRAPRADLLRAARVRRGADTADFGLPGSPTRFYVNERLTRLNRSLFYSARQECRRLDWRYPWTTAGRVYVRRDRDGPAQRIRSSEDIAQVFGTLLR